MFLELGFLALIAASAVSLLLPTNIVVVRRLNPDTNYPPFEDLFSNRQCSSSTCPSRSTCAGGRCCMCRCLYDYPNVFMNKTIDSLRCTNYDEINSLSSANCQYSFRRTNEPLEVIPLTEVASGKIRFRNTLVDCAENSLSVGWQYLDKDHGRWENGMGNVFDVDFVGVGSNRKDLSFLNWNAKLDAKYAGLIIRISLGCAGRNVGCVLAKINGTYTFSGKLTTSRAPTSKTPSPESTTGSIPTTSKSKQSDVVVSGTDLRTDTRSTVETPTPLVREQQSSKARTSNDFAILALSAAAGLICLIVLVCLIVVLYKKRKRRLPVQEKGQPEIDSIEMEGNQDPIYAEPDETQISDNPLYSKNNVEEHKPIMRRSKLDPLPSLPPVTHGERSLLAREA